MKRLQFFIAILLLLHSVAMAQDTELSGILSAKDDTTKASALVKYIRLFLDTDKEKAGMANENLLQLGNKLNDPYWTGLSWFFRGYLEGKQLKNREALENYQTALRYLKKTNKIERIAICHLNMAVLADVMGDVNQKMQHLSEAIRLLDGTEYKSKLNMAYNQMGTMMFNMENYPKASSYFNKVIQSAKEIKDTFSLVIALCGRSNCFASARQFAEAYTCTKEALDLATAGGGNVIIFVAHSGMIDLYRRWGKADLTIYYSKQLLQKAMAAGDLQFILYANLGLADGYGLANDKRKTIYYLSKAQALSEGKGLVYQATIIYKVLSETYTQLNEPGKALEYYKKYILYRDSTTNQKVKRDAAELEIKYQTAQKEKALSQKQLQLAQKDLQIQKSRSYMYYTFAGLAVALFLAIILFLQSRHKKQVHTRELKSLRQQRELQLLQAIMQGEEKERSRIAKDLHDGVAGMLAAVKMHFSSIPAVDDLLHTEGYQQGMKLLNDATQEIRKTSHNLMPEVLLQHGLDEALRRYCNNLYNSKTISIQYDSWGDIERFADSFELSVYRIVQELVNNIIKHSKATEAMVQVTQRDNLLSISIEDNGVGFQKNQHADGMGLRSLQSRIKAMNGKIEMQVSEQTGVTAYLEFEVSELKKEIAVVYE